MINRITSLLNKQYIKVRIIEKSEFPIKRRDMQLAGVPKVVISDAVELVGTLPETAFCSAPHAQKELKENRNNIPILF